ncbi:MAG TPA: hypothetical protein VGI31_07790, partial [Streptosporangiaceae bacterium]
HSWAVESTPNPSGALASYLNGVSCVSADSCTAVGSYHPARSGRNVTLAEHWDGSTWAIQATRNPSGSSDSSLLAVSCASAASCTAAGHAGSSRVNVLLAEHWDGARWAIQATPAPSGSAASGFFGVSCAGSQCTAAGFSSGSSGSSGSGGDLTLAERWSGGSWSVQPTPDPAGAADSVFYGISCDQAAACTAAGEYVTSSGATDALAESWDGSTWTVQATPSPSAASVPSSALGGVSCITAAACTAVGEYLSGKHFLTLAERG